MARPFPTLRAGRRPTTSTIGTHPVLLARSAWERVPDEGARAFDVALVDCEDLTPPGDVDLPY